MKEEIQKLIDELTPKENDAWQAIQKFDESPQYLQQLFLRQKLIDEWCTVNSKTVALRELLKTLP